MPTTPTMLRAEETTELDAVTETVPFTSYSDVLAEVEGVFQARRQWQRAFEQDHSVEVAERKEARYRSLRSTWLARTEASALPLCRRCVAFGLTGIEHELFWGVLSMHTVETQQRFHDNTTRALLNHISIERHERLAAIKQLRTEAPLIKSKLLILGGDLDDEPLKVDVFPDSFALEQLFFCGAQTDGYWVIENEHELYSCLRKFYRLLGKQADAFVAYRFADELDGSDMMLCLRIHREWKKFLATLKRHPTLSWNRPEVQDLSGQELRVVVALASDALGILAEEEELFTGLGLISTLTSRPDFAANFYDHFRPDSKLLREQWIRPISGESQHYNGTDNEIPKTRFELGDRAYELLALEQSGRRTIAGITLREPRITLDDLALSSSIEQAIRLTVTQARAERTLLREWGLAERLQYGLYPVLLFYGPPGTGKTATAEALAHELGRPLIVADYSMLENSFIGVTEKNIVRVFREAQRRRAVLFWDEADAMLFDRDDAHRNWEVRHVNVILQQIERFEGVCILATNRKQCLDKALARRISMQVEFRRPESAHERLRIWKAMLPPQLPLDSTVDFGVIAQEDLSGGEIKNVLLNAARFAAARGDAIPRLTHVDFEEAVRWETQAREKKHNPVGFCRASLR